MSRASSAWLQAWDELDLEWQRLEKLLLLLLFVVMLLVLLARLAVAAVGGQPAAWLAAVPVALTLPLVLISACSASAWLCLRAQQAGVESARASWLSAARWLLAGVACILLASAAMRYVAFDMQMSSVAPFSLTGWWQLALLPVAFVLMGLRLLRQALREMTASA